MAKKNIVQILLDNGANVNVQESILGNTPLLLVLFDHQNAFDKNITKVM